MRSRVVRRGGGLGGRAVGGRPPGHSRSTWTVTVRRSMQKAASPPPPPSRRRGILQMTDETPGVTSKRYWDKAAEDWEDIQDTFRCDSFKVIPRTFAKYRSSAAAGVCIDFGCGGGRYLAFLASQFQRVLGLDISDALIALAQKEVAHRRLKNVELRVADLGRNGVVEGLGPTLPRCTAAVCTNVLLSPEPSTRSNILRLVADRLDVGGLLFLLVPAVASALNIRATHSKWLRERRRRGYRRDSELEAAEHSEADDVRRDIFERMGVRHKQCADTPTEPHASRVCRSVPCSGGTARLLMLGAARSVAEQLPAG